MAFFSSLRPGRRDLALLAVGFAGLLGWVRSPRAAPRTDEIADLTWPEVRDAIADGWVTALVPTGGLEQNGPQMVIGKHDYLARWSAKRIAAELGHTLLAPVVSYVPEGDYEPPSGNMRWPGTIGVPPAVFAGVIDGIARSLKLAGFRNIVFFAEHGGSVQPLADTVAKLNAEWQGSGVRVIDATAYYDTGTAEDDWLRHQGEAAEAVGPHASITDTSELMAVHPDGVDLGRLPANPAQLAQMGATGDPGRATVARGEVLMAMKLANAVQQIRAAIGGT